MFSAMLTQLADKAPTAPADLLPPAFAAWFARRGWAPRPHQLELLAKGNARRSALLIAPTGAGKTLAGFLPSLVALAARGKVPPGSASRGIHTLYISPLKALAVDIARNLDAPVAEMKLPVTVETRTGDTPAHKRQRQKLKPPDILLTTPEQLALLIAQPDAERFFSDLDTVILDELHALVTSKRGDLLSLGLARLRAIAPQHRAVGLSATVSDPLALAEWLVPQVAGCEVRADLVTVAGGAKPEIRILESEERIPWSGHSARYALPEVYAAIAASRMAIVFVNTRSQAELVFAELWNLNELGLPIALHHGSLDAGQRRKVEAAMGAGRLRAVVATSTLDLGIDWGDVDLVVHVGAPKGASRLAQRIGRANHRMDEPSQAILVPANRFEVLECRSALDANYLGAQDTPPLRRGGLDVLAQHVLGRAVAGPFVADAFFAEVRSAWPYRELEREAFERTVEFVANGGYALRSYERFAKIRQTVDGSYRLTHPRFAQQYRLNVGTIIEAPLLKVRLGGNRGRPGAPLRGGRVLGEVEEYFAEMLAPGDTFLFGGEVLRYETIRENEMLVTRARDEAPKVPSYAGGKFPLSTYLAAGVRAMLADPAEWHRLPAQVQEWLTLQKQVSALPGRDNLLIETFPRADRFYMVAYPFEGRLAHQTLGMLLTRRLERARMRPLGFLATDYCVAVWGLGDMGRLFSTGGLDPGALFDPDMLGDDLEAWLDETWLMKRSFRACALIAGLVERRHPGQEKSGRQVTVSTDLVYDVLRSHEPDHILMRATRADAAEGLLDVARLGEMLARVSGRIVHKRLERISPLAVPIMLELGRERVDGESADVLLSEVADELMREAAGE
ncbi:ligase-associated DNA damage response DEXH box helicase [Methylobrevis albus]|uniref:Ligase-associated DNA damage response DEXH box helicase n=1 Tax=Methylobrevis albus TaxID=2793297 RepID=A0A931I127_9HYPH|nr:ligase-associated DNA damage response DEXH box helicase [Methylobrevis albus]MBH0237419.1 ligase-associated DNA damage response DEXH box helicase [Methylobrevis albus]